MKKLKPLVTRLDCPLSFIQYIARLRAKYKAKRNFIKMLEMLQG